MSAILQIRDRYSQPNLSLKLAVVYNNCACYILYLYIHPNNKIMDRTVLPKYEFQHYVAYTSL